MDQPKHKFLLRAEEGRMHWGFDLLVILAIIFAAFAIGSLPQLALLPTLKENMNNPDFNPMSSEQTGLPEMYLFFMALFTFPAALLGLWFGVKYFAKRSFSSVLTGFQKVRWGRFFLGAGIWFAFQAVVLGSEFVLHPDNIEFVWEPGRFLPLLIMFVILVPIQSSTEEIVFRGFLMQFVARLTNQKWIPLVVTSVLFGLVHSANPEVDQYGFWVMMAQYITMGLILGAVALSEEGLEAAMGLHSANNLFAFLFVAYPGMALPTPALFRLKEIHPVQDLIVVAVAGIIFILILNAKRMKSFFQLVLGPEPRAYNGHGPLEEQKTEAPLEFSDGPEDGLN